MLEVYLYMTMLMMIKTFVGVIRDRVNGSADGMDINGSLPQSQNIAKSTSRA